MLHLQRNIKLIRKLYGLNQREFGAKMGVSIPMIKSYEGGKAKPDDLFMGRLATMTGVSEDDIRNRKLLEADLAPQKVEKVELPQTGNNEVLSLLMLMYEQMKAQNRILETTTIKEISSINKQLELSSQNVAKALAGVSSIVVQMDAEREVVLKSLARIEKKPEGSLVEELGRTIVNRMKGQRKQGKSVGIGN